jgi:hypothetical protein
MDIEPILEQHRAERNYLGQLLLNALLENMPWGLKVELPNGASAVLTRLNDPAKGSQPYRPPIYRDNATPERTGNEKIIGYDPWRMVFDFKLKHCDQDHIEITAEITGGGGAIE